MSDAFLGPLTLYSAAVADTNGIAIDCKNLATIGVQLTGTLTSVVVYFEGTTDNTNWVAVGGFNRATGVKLSQATAVGQYVFNVAGLSQFRARLDWTTGDVTATAIGSAYPINAYTAAS